MSRKRRKKNSKPTPANETSGMTLEQIIPAFPNLKKDMLYQVREKGLIQPALVGGRNVKQYSRGDVRKIALVARYCSEGMSLTTAIEQAKVGRRHAQSWADLVRKAFLAALGQMRSASHDSWRKAVAFQACALARAECAVLYLPPDSSQPVAVHHYVGDVTPKRVGSLQGRSEEHTSELQSLRHLV